MTNLRSTLVALLIGVLIILGTSVYLYLTSDQSASQHSLVGEPFREFTSPTGFLNTNEQAITIGEHVGRRVLLIEFMRYGCPNCQRSFPHLVALHEQYRDQGLTVIGIHTPQFPHEGVRENVEKALAAVGITFPVVLDNEYGTWNAYENNYWPRTLIINKEGVITFDGIGAGNTAEIDAALERLLTP
jgi:thiol-disulfide isomerase/thioredoxin